MRRLVTVALLGAALGAGSAYGQLLNTGVIQGKITDTLSNPLESATVWATPPSDYLDSIDTDITDARGRYTLVIPLQSDQDSSIVDVHASKINYVPKDTQDVVVKFGQIAQVNLILKSMAGPIRGVVWDSTYSSERIEGVLVSAVREEGGETFLDYTDSYGRYVLDVLEEGAYQVNFSHAEYTDESYTVNVVFSSYTLNVLLDRSIWYVSVDGNNITGRGSSTRPFGTIQWAVNKTSRDDTVLVTAGTYRGQGNRDISVYGDTITIMSEAGAEADTIDCEADQSDQARGFDFKDVGPFTTLDGFTIVNGYNTSGGAVYCYDDGSPTIANCIFRENEAREGGGAVCVKLRSHAVIRNCRIVKNESSQGAGIIVDGGSNPTIEDCVIDSNIASYHGGAIIMDSESNPIIQNCLLNANLSDEIGGAVHILGDCSPLLSNCTIINNEAALGPGGGIFCEDELEGNIVIKNCIVRGNTAAGLPSEIDTSEATPTVSYSDVCGDWIGTGNIDCDPWFCYADTGDYHLAANSHCLGAGENGAYIGAYDQDCPSVGIVYGLVTLEATGEPLAGAIIQATVVESCLVVRFSAPTQSDGHYRLVIPGAPGHVNLICSHPDPALEECGQDDVNLIDANSDSTNINFIMLAGGGFAYLAGDANMFNEIVDLGDSLTGPWRMPGDVTFLVNYFDISSGNQPCLMYNPNTPDLPGGPQNGYFFASADATGDCLVSAGDISRLVQYFAFDPDAPIRWCGWDESDPQNYYPPLWLSNRGSGGEQPVPPLEGLPEGWPNCQTAPPTVKIIATGRAE